MFSILFVSCGNSKTQPQTVSEKDVKKIDVPAFSADSAYEYVQKQVDFGPRTPNSTAHDKCKDYLIKKMNDFGAKVTVQDADLRGYDGKLLKSSNIIASYNPEATTRVLLFAHWDTRPWADNDPDKKNHKTPILGANDGASGVGVLMEMARAMKKTVPNIGVDIAFFDMEDYGSVNGDEDFWCLGTQYWAKNLKGYRANYGILLDMVGAPNATFYREQFSDLYAQSVVDKVWAMASSLGFGQYFVNQQGGAITDDHIYINKIAGIPSIDIIQFDKNTPTGFAPYWHTLDDTMKNIDKNTLNAVGTTLMNVIYNE